MDTFRKAVREKMLKIFTSSFYIISVEPTQHQYHLSYANDLHLIYVHELLR